MRILQLDLSDKKQARKRLRWRWKCPMDDKRLPKQDRKRLQIENAPHKTQRAKLLHLADKICNVYDTYQSPPADWSLQRKQEYLLWTEKVISGLRGVNANLERRYDELLAEGKQRLGM